MKFPEKPRSLPSRAEDERRGSRDVEDAQSYLARDNFDLMFLDLRLPDGDGTDFLRS